MGDRPASAVHGPYQLPKLYVDALGRADHGNHHAHVLFPLGAPADRFGPRVRMVRLPVLPPLGHGPQLLGAGRAGGDPCLLRSGRIPGADRCPARAVAQAAAVGPRHGGAVVTVIPATWTRPAALAV